MTALKSLIGGLALAGGVLGASSVYAADISTTTTLNLASGSSIYGHAIDANSLGATFTDKFYFTLTATSNLSAGLAAFSFTPVDSIEITDFSLFNSGGFSLPGTQTSTGALDSWTAGSSHLVADTYYLQVTGKVLSAAATSYGGGVAVAVTPVPEPETYGMLLAGLGLVGAIARRKASKAA